LLYAPFPLDDTTGFPPIDFAFVAESASESSSFLPNPDGGFVALMAESAWLRIVAFAVGRV
jgi:hypothetical protein